MIRDLQRSDAPALFDLMTREFPEESALLGGRPEEFEKIIRTALRWDVRLLVGLLRLFGRPIFRVLVLESDGRPVGMTLVSFEGVSAYVSSVVVDPAYRRRGFARKMLAEAAQTARRGHRRYLVLGVLDRNAPARTLYESVGFRPLQAEGQLVCNPASRFSPAPPTVPGIRPFRRSDAAALVAIARGQAPPPVETVTPTTKRQFRGFLLANRILAAEEARWVIDRGRGPEAFLAATLTRAFDAAHMSAPVVADSVDDGLAESLVRTAGAWCAARQVPRILSMVADHNRRGRAALEAAGFQHAFALQTLYRTVD